MNEKARILSVFCLLWAVVLGSYVAAASLSRSQSVPSHGSRVAVNVGVFQDAACTVNTTSIDWGVVDSGATVTRSVYVKNTGNTAVALSLWVGNWVPSNASVYLAVSWDREAMALSAGQVVQATFTLTVSSNVTGVTDFSNVLVVTGTH